MERRVLMNWETVQVSEEDFTALKTYNRPIETAGNIKPHTPVVVDSILGQLNAVYDPQVGIRKINDYNPQFKKSQNRDLALFNDFLSNDSINTVIVDGLFGTGKTSNVMGHVVTGLKTEKIKKLILSKPHVPTGSSYGHLPGPLEEKIAYEFKSYYQYFDRFWQVGMAEKLMMDLPIFEESMDKKGPQVEAMVFEYLRGLDLEDDTWVILDEAQNTTIQEMVSFISRLNDGVKVIILGDTNPMQIDKHSLRKLENNGLHFLKEGFKNFSNSGTVELKSRSHILRGNRVKHLFDIMPKNL